MARILERVRPESEERDYAGGLQRVMEHGGEVPKTCLDGYRTGQKARKELLSKMIKLRETEQKTKDDECKDSSTLNKKKLIIK